MYEDAESHAAGLLEARKKFTRTSSNRDLRAEHAVSVWACANASGSLRLLSETVKWAKPFVRDQLTAFKLFSTYYDETYRLLSGFLSHSNGVPKLEILRERVKYANAIMVDLLDIACSALHEPCFQSSNWHQTVGIFTRVVKERMELSTSMEKDMKVSDKDIYHVLWENTIATLIRAEQMINQEENEKLGANTISGIVIGKTAFTEAGLKTNNKATWMFLDNLARARNDLWKGLRHTLHPDVLTLPEPFPRGLPIQHLLACWIPNTADLCELAPYIFSRVECTLFVSSEAALKLVPSDERTQHAMGAFVDSYQYALSAYIPDVCDAQEKEERLAKVWSYATGPLSEREMEPEEAVRYWKRHIPSHLQSSLNRILPKREHVQWPAVPRHDNPSDTHEWNPLEGRPTDVKVGARELGKATYIDFCTIGDHAQLTKPHIRSYYEPPVPRVPGEEISVGSIWSCHSTDAENEAGALAALLYLDTKYGSTERILATPFPSRDDVRYPCLYLDEDFLSREELSVLDAAAFISKNKRLVPSSLVHALATALVSKFNEKQNRRIVNEAAFALIRALSESDKPGLAFELAIEVIIEHPSASSWHRMLFHDGFLRRLPASDARACISRFSKAVGEKLDEQNLKTRSDGAGRQQVNTKFEETAQAPEHGAVQGNQTNQANIKITTLKSLAQVLRGSAYIGDDLSLQILSNLASKISHVDVRLSILQTLLSKLDVDRPEFWDVILSTVQSFIPLISSLDEREPMTDNDWAHAEETMTIPKVVRLTTANTWREESPMLYAIMQRYLDVNGSELKELYLRRITLPAVELLKQQTAKWATLFLKRYASNDVSILETVLPPVPRGIAILELILSQSEMRPHRIPQTLLDEHVAYMRFRIDPPTAIRALNKSLREDIATKSSPEVATWLELHGDGVQRTWFHRLPFTCISNFNDQESGNDQVYITCRTYQKKWLELFTVFLWVDGPNYPELRVFVSTLTNPFNLSCPWWNEYGRTTIEAMFAHVNSIRTRDWEADPSRKPAVLPDTFDWKLSLLSYPLTDLYKDNDQAREQACKKFADELSIILDDISSSMYHTKFAQIQGRVCNGRNLSNKEFKNNLLLSALYLGDISKTRLSWLTTPDLLRVDLAADMVLETKGMDNGGLGSKLTGMLDSWLESENEEVRRTGYRVQNEYLDADGKRVVFSRQGS
ncbi:hypothetical protein M3J07_001169 [Ascochyta lentis]